MIRVTAALLAGATLAAFAPPLVSLDAPSPITSVSAEQLDRLPAGQRVEDLLKSCPASTVPTLTRPGPSTITLRGLPPQPGLSCIQPEDIQMVEVLKNHNDIRAIYGARPLVWDPLLASQARSNVHTLAGIGRLVHSPRAGREWSRENLLQALPGTPVGQMVKVWIDERRFFKPGLFPDISLTGDWYVAGHFTQMIWPTTTAVGCGVQRGIGNYDWMICQYSPPGNQDGKPVGYPSMPQPRHAAGSPPGPQMRGVAGQDLQMVLEADTGAKVIGGEWVGPTSTRTPQPRGVAGQDGIAPATSTTTTAPPPPPTARDEAPEGKEEKHPLVNYYSGAFARYVAAVNCGDQAAADAEMARMRYALEELRKRLRAARRAGPYSGVNPADVQAQINNLEQMLRSAGALRPTGACPPMPQPRGIVAQ